MNDTLITVLVILGAALTIGVGFAAGQAIGREINRYRNRS